MKLPRFKAQFKKQLQDGFTKAGVCHAPALSYSALAFFAVETYRLFQRSVVVVTDSTRTLEEFQDNLEVFAAEEQILLLPADDLNSIQKPSKPSQVLQGERFSALRKLATASRPLVITCVQALMQTAPVRSDLLQQVRRLQRDQNYDPAELLELLVSSGFEITSEVQLPGQAARRGGVLDVWLPGEELPCRLEFFDETLESLRWFDPLTQRSQSRTDELVMSLQKSRAEATEAWRTPAEYLADDALYFWVDAFADNLVLPAGSTVGIKAHAELLWKMTLEEDKTVVPLSTVRAVLNRFKAEDSQPVSSPLPSKPPEITVAAKPVWECYFGAVETGNDGSPNLGFRSLKSFSVTPESTVAPDALADSRHRWLEDLERSARHGRRVCIFFNTKSTRERFKSLYPHQHFDLRLGNLSDGFDNDHLDLTVVSEADLLGRRKLRQAGSKRRQTRAAHAAITDISSIEPGDLVVHLEHGIGRYLGLYEIEFNGQNQEVLTLEYADQARLHVPVAQAHLLSRYIGSSRSRTVELHRLTGIRWRRERQAAELAVRDLAADLLETQALRSARSGFAFPPDLPWQDEFEAAFPYHETEDQENAIQDVKRDMESAKPMDRLICGDAGYGKTEVALRAAFKCVLAGKQAAMLVPTTVLAQQHFENFRARLAAYPVRIEQLCRFQSPGAQARVVRELRSGVVDIVVGTHRLIQADISFKNLGLVIIDEEQRFGVEHKERLKAMKQLVDVLTLTATPIPRTLYLSLTGAREISVIQTPPQERQPVETVIARSDDALIQKAVLRELNRGGQVYFLYNRVMTIQRMATRLRQLIPEARFGVAHGQMAAGELSSVMREFSAGKMDVLICTTIIESGMDIANVNTIIIDRADRFGMAELYQLRGRVGRANRKAYAYLLLPPHGHLLTEARRRLGAIMEYSGAGAGFRLALRDLEIRGAGNLLGAAQSGHIAAIGFELYCQLLRQAVNSLSGGEAKYKPPRLFNVELKLDFMAQASLNSVSDSGAFLPYAYLEDERLRLDFFRRLAGAELEDLDALRSEMLDRFGAFPVPVERLFKLVELRRLAGLALIDFVEVKGKRVLLRRGTDYIQYHNQFPRLKKVNTDDRLEELRELLIQEQRVTETDQN